MTVTTTYTEEDNANTNWIYNVDLPFVRYLLFFWFSFFV